MTVRRPITTALSTSIPGTNELGVLAMAIGLRTTPPIETMVSLRAEDMREERVLMSCITPLMSYCSITMNRTFQRI